MNEYFAILRAYSADTGIRGRNNVGHIYNNFEWFDFKLFNKVFDGIDSEFIWPLKECFVCLIVAGLGTMHTRKILILPRTKSTKYWILLV